MRISELAAKAGVEEFFDYQLECFEKTEALAGEVDPRICLYYKTGAGKSITALVCLSLWGHTETVVVAPPSTHDQWVEAGRKLDINVMPMSHAKFRMPKTQLRRDVPVIADEIHLFGGHDGMGWKKLDRLSRGLKAPLILASATPNYNDADRVYCIQHILDPMSCRGGFLEFLYANCVTEQNPFGVMPNVIGFRNYPNAAEYLAAMPHVMYLPDDLVYTIQDTVVAEKIPPEMERFGYNARQHRVMASGIEARHIRVFQSLVGNDGFLEPDVLDVLEQTIAAGTPLLVYANHSTVAEAIGRTLEETGLARYAVVTGKATQKLKSSLIQGFKDGDFDVLVGTATLATGTDGLDKACDRLLILDDTEDNSLRRQLIGRIMPRGIATSATHKQVHRLLLQ